MEKSIIKLLLLLIIWNIIFWYFLLEKVNKIKTDTGRNYKNILKCNK